MIPKEAKNFLLNMVTEMEQVGLRANYIRNFGKAAKSWFRHKDIEVNVRIKASKKNEVEKYGREQPPTPNELKKILLLIQRTFRSFSLTMNRGETISGDETFLQQSDLIEARQRSLPTAPGRSV